MNDWLRRNAWKFAVGTAAVAVLSLVILLLPSRESKKVERVRPDRSEPTYAPAISSTQLRQEVDRRASEFVATGKKGDPLRYRFAEGDVLTYTVESERTVIQRSAIAVGALQFEPTAEVRNGSTSLDFSLIAAMDLRVYQAGERGFRIGYRFRDVKIEAGGEATQGIHRLEEMEKMLASGIAMVRMSATGVVGSVEFPSEWRAEAKNAVRSIVCDHRIQFPDDYLESWELEETDTTGRFTASYSIAEGADRDGAARVRISKAKKDYKNVFTHAPAGAASNLKLQSARTSDSCDAIFDRAQGRILSLRQEGRIFLGVASECEFESTGSTRMALVGVERGVALAGAWASPATGGLLPDAGMDVEEERRRAWLKRQEEEKTTLQGLLDRWAELAAKEGGSRFEMHELFRALVEFLRYGEGGTGAVMAMLGQGDLSDAKAQFLIGALGGAGTPAAQGALGDLVSDRRYPQEYRTGAAISAAMMPRTPLPGLEARLRAVARSESDPAVQGTALAAVGTMAATVAGEGDEKRAASLVKFVEESKTVREDAGWKIQWVMAMGNTHSASAYPALEAELSNPHRVVAANAAEALGMIPDPQVEPRLGQLAVTKQVHEDVVVGAVRGLENRETAQARAILGALAERDPREAVRKRAQRAIDRLPDTADIPGVPMELMRK